MDANLDVNVNLMLILLCRPHGTQIYAKQQRSNPPASLELVSDCSNANCKSPSRITETAIAIVIIILSKRIRLAFLRIRLLLLLRLFLLVPLMRLNVHLTARQQIGAQVYPIECP